MIDKAEMIESGARIAAAASQLSGATPESIWIAERLLAAWEPIIRADECQKTLEFCCDDTRPEIIADIRAQVTDLRDKAENAPPIMLDRTIAVAQVQAYDAVLALIEGGDK